MTKLLNPASKKKLTKPMQIIRRYFKRRKAWHGLSEADHLNARGDLSECQSFTHGKLWGNCSSSDGRKLKNCFWSAAHLGFRTGKSGNITCLRQEIKTDSAPSRALNGSSLNWSYWSLFCPPWPTVKLEQEARNKLTCVSYQLVNVILAQLSGLHT